MYVVWFSRIMFGSQRSKAEFADVRDAREFWDLLASAGWYLVSTRP